MLEIWWIRHGETDWNREARIQGTSDVALNDLGRAQAGALAARLDPASFDAVYASDLVRASETARLALPGTQAKLDARVQEFAYGALEGRRWTDELPADIAAGVAAWRAQPNERRVPGGESYADLSLRVGAFVTDLPRAGRVAVFSHGGTIRSALYAVTGRAPGATWRIDIANTSITRFRYDRRGATVVVVNDHAHLDHALDTPVATRDDARSARAPAA